MNSNTSAHVSVDVADRSLMTTIGSDPPDRDVASDSGHERERHLLLHIEDNKSNLALLEWILDREADVELCSAMLGGRGLELAREQQPDLIVLDLQLPDMSGETVLQCLQEDVATRPIPVVILSGDDSVKRRQRLLKLGARDYLVKPLDIRHFLDVVVANIESREQREARARASTQPAARKPDEAV